MNYVFLMQIKGSGTDGQKKRIKLRHIEGIICRYVANTLVPVAAQSKA
jgi:hypothetical protein